MQIPSYRKINLTGALLAIVAISFSFGILQRYLELDPCPLCAADRIVVITLGVVFTLAWIHNPARIGQKAYALLNLPIVLIGIGLTLRHIWLQSLPPDQVPECGPDITYLFEVFPLLDALRMLLTGSGECAEVQWKLFGLSIPEQTLILFSIFSVLIAFQLFRRR